MSGSFSSQEIELTKSRGFIIFPDGYEELFLGIYFLIIPYLSGLFFMFLFVANLKLEMFSSLAKSGDSIFLLWIIGYEFDAAIILLIIAIKAFNFKPTDKGRRRKFVRP